MEFAGQQIDYGYMPAAHTDGDLFVHVPKLNLLVVGGVVSAEEWPLLDYQNGAWLGGRVRALERLADLVKPDTRVVPADGRVMTGSDIVRHRDMYQKLFTTMIGYLNMGLGPEDAVQRNPLKEYPSSWATRPPSPTALCAAMMILLCAPIDRRCCGGRTDRRPTPFGGVRLPHYLVIASYHARRVVEVCSAPHRAARTSGGSCGHDLHNARRRGTAGLLSPSPQLGDRPGHP